VLPLCNVCDLSLISFSHCALTVLSLSSHGALTVLSLCPHCALTVLSLSSHCALIVLSLSSLAPPVVSEVVNKRGRRCMWEYECRWVGFGADETTWETIEDLSSPAASQAVQIFEAAMKSQSRSALRCLAEKPIRTECCNTIVESETYDETRGKCRDTDACFVRRH
jgi:hypothetical protein